MEDRELRPEKPFNFRRDDFGRLGLDCSPAEPLRVYCHECGAEIDPWKILSGPPRLWWRCPRACNRAIPDDPVH